MKKSNDIQSRRKQLKLRITIVILIFLLAAIGLGVHVVQNYIPSREHMSLTEYYGQPSVQVRQVSLKMEKMGIRFLLVIL